MKWNPFLNALVAAAYIGAMVLFMSFITSISSNTPDTPIDGVGVLLLFVLSVATMAFLFFYQPVVLLIEKKQGEALSYFLKTLGAFGAITVAALTLVSLQ